MNRYKIAVGMITGDHKAHIGVLKSFMDFSNMVMSRSYDFTPIFDRGLYLDKNRNNVGAMFMHETDCDFLWFLDSDNGFYPDALRYFMEDFSNPDIHLVSGKYFYKNDSGDMVAGVTNELCQDGFYNMLPEGAFSEPLINISQVGRGAMVGTGCLMLRREVLDKVPYPWFQTPWKQYEDGGWSLTGEDTFFCERVEEYGYSIYLDQRIRSPHYAGSKCYPKGWDQFQL